VENLIVVHDMDAKVT
jgi:hypothetical protein